MSRSELDRLIGLGTSGKWEEVLAATRSLPIDEFADQDAALILFFEGSALLHLEQPDQAQQAVQMGLEYTSTRPELLDLAARVAQALGQVSEAAVYHERAMAHAPVQIRPLLLINYASTLVSDEDYSGALRLLEQAVDEGQGCYEASLLAGRCLANLGRHREALMKYFEASRARPGELAPRMGLADMLAVLGKSRQADALYAQLMGSAGDSQILYNWALNRLTSGDPVGAVKLCRKGEPGATGYGALVCLHGKALLAMGADEAALQLFARGIPMLESSGSNAALYDDFSVAEAETLGDLGESEKARRRIGYRIARFRRNLPRAQSVLALMNEPPRGGVLVFEVAVEPGGGSWSERLVVQASSQADALALASEVHLPDDLAGSATSVRQGGAIPAYARRLPPVRGVLERRFETVRSGRKK